MDDEPPPDVDVDSYARTFERETPTDQLSPDTIHRLLANARRRALLSYLTSRPGEEVPVEDVVAVVAEAEHPDRGPCSHRERIATDIHHVHLPKLASAEVVSFDPVAWTVRYEPDRELQAFLAMSDAIEERDE